MSPDAQIGAFVDAANTHPVFELTLTPSDTPGARISVSRRQGDGRTPLATRPHPIVGILIATGPDRARCPAPGTSGPRCPVSPNPSHGRPSYLRSLRVSLRQDESCRLRYVRQLRPAAQKCREFAGQLCTFGRARANCRGAVVVVGFDEVGRVLEEVAEHVGGAAGVAEAGVPAAVG